MTAKRAYFFGLTDEIENNANVHRVLVARVEAMTKRNLVCYVANAHHPGGALQDVDPDLVESVLRTLDMRRHGGRLDLLVSSPGGFPYAAGKIVKVCRTFSTEFRAIVLGRALSAGTLLCLGAQELLMSETASLGPIDPQVVKGNRLVPAQVVVESFRSMLAGAQQAIASKQPPDPFLHVLDSLDVTVVYESIKAVNATRAIAGSLLRDGLLRGAPPETIEQVVARLITEGEKELHGKHLYPADLVSQIGLPVTVLDKGSRVDRLLHELATRVDLHLNGKRQAKYLLTRDGALDLNVQVLR